jgi:hypothetical protein
MTTSSSAPLVEAPWKQSKKGSVYCMWDDLSDDLKSQLREEDKFQTTIAKSHYYVLKTDEGGFLVFRNPKPENKQQEKYDFNNKLHNSLTELAVLPLEQANNMLQSGKEYVLIGDDPIKIVNGQFFAVLGKKRD